MTLLYSVFKLLLTKDAKDKINNKINKIKECCDWSEFDVGISMNDIDLSRLNYNEVINEKNMWETIAKLSINLLNDFDYYRQFSFETQFDSSTFMELLENLGCENVDGRWRCRQRPDSSVVQTNVLMFCLFRLIHDKMWKLEHSGESGIVCFFCGFKLDIGVVRCSDCDASIEEIRSNYEICSKKRCSEEDLSVVCDGDKERTEEISVVKGSNQWRCEHCESINEYGSESCFVCFERMPDWEGWICEICTIGNSLRTIKCDGCDIYRSDYDGMKTENVATNVCPSGRSSDNCPIEMESVRQNDAKICVDESRNEVDGHVIEETIERDGEDMGCSAVMTDIGREKEEETVCVWDGSTEDRDNDCIAPAMTTMKEVCIDDGTSGDTGARDGAKDLLIGQSRSDDEEIKSNISDNVEHERDTDSPVYFEKIRFQVGCLPLRLDDERQNTESDTDDKDRRVSSPDDRGSRASGGESPALVGNVVAHRPRNTFPVGLEDHWNCGKCGFLNKLQSNDCVICGEAAPHKDRWRCDGCTYINEALAPSCDVCSSINRHLPQTVSFRSFAVDDPPQRYAVQRGGFRGSRSMRTQRTRPQFRARGRGRGRIQAIRPRWFCRFCGDSNDASAPVCDNCQAEKDDY